MGKRKSQRVEERVPARIFGLDQKGKPFSVQVETVDISFGGARLAGVKQFETAGETIGLEYNGKKGRFAVVWVGRQGTKNEGQVGVRNIDARNSIWALDQPREAMDSYQPMHISNSLRAPELISYLEYRRDRRMLRRVPVKAGARVTSKARRDPAWGVCTDINRSGCFVETAWPFTPDGASLEISLRLNGREIAARGVVRSASPNRGMGIEFVEIGEADRQYLEELAQEKTRAPDESNGFHHIGALFMLDGIFQPTHLLVILIIALFVFGPKRLPELGKGLGDGLRALKEGLREQPPAAPTAESKDQTAEEVKK
jgi:sec-independent protein translocase protein TatA